MIEVIQKKTLRSTVFEFAILFTLKVPIGAKPEEVTAWANANLLEGGNPTVDSVKFIRHEYGSPDSNRRHVTISGDHQLGGEDEQSSSG